MANAGERHSYSVFVCSRNRFIILNGASGLDDRRNTASCGFIYIVAEREEGV